jgi:hypothetical protein
MDIYDEFHIEHADAADAQDPADGLDERLALLKAAANAVAAVDMSVAGRQVAVAAAPAPPPPPSPAGDESDVSSISGDNSCDLLEEALDVLGGGEAALGESDLVEGAETLDADTDNDSVFDPDETEPEDTDAEEELERRRTQKRQKRCEADLFGGVSC